MFPPAHPISRGDYGALVFAGPAEAFGELCGLGTWSTARKFVLGDPRSRGAGAAPDPALPFAVWPEPVLRPVPGVCFLFAVPDHPGVRELLAAGARRGENFVCLGDAAPTHPALPGFHHRAGGRPIALLGYGDQGESIARSLVDDLGVAPERVVAHDDRPDRLAAARARGLGTGPVDRFRPDGPVISTPLVRPASFDAPLACARAAGVPVLDNALLPDNGPELRPRGGDGRVLLTPGAERSLGVEDGTLRARHAVFPLNLQIIREGDRRLGPMTVPSLHAAWRGELVGTIALARPHPSDPLAHLAAGDARRTFVSLDGQSNHADAAFAIFAAREFLRRWFPTEVRALLPAEHRTALGATAFERILAGSAVGRRLAPAWMSPIEQTALGVVARAGALGRPIVEIGSALGGSTLLLAAATQDGPRTPGPDIVSIDPDAATRPAMLAALREAGCDARVRQIVEPSGTALGSLDALAGRAGLVFIDGLHTFDAAREDFVLAAPLVAPGGIVAFHDCTPRFAGVHRAVAAAAGDPRFEPLFMADSLAVFRRRGAVMPPAGPPS